MSFYLAMSNAQEKKTAWPASIFLFCLGVYGVPSDNASREQYFDCGFIISLICSACFPWEQQYLPIILSIVSVNAVSYTVPEWNFCLKTAYAFVLNLSWAGLVKLMLLSFIYLQSLVTSFSFQYLLSLITSWPANFFIFCLGVYSIPVDEYDRFDYLLFCFPMSLICYVSCPWTLQYLPMILSTGGITFVCLASHQRVCSFRRFSPYILINREIAIRYALLTFTLAGSLKLIVLASFISWPVNIFLFCLGVYSNPSYDPDRFDYLICCFVISLICCICYPWELQYLPIIVSTVGVTLYLCTSINLYIYSVRFGRVTMITREQAITFALLTFALVGSLKLILLPLIFLLI
jgi:hypothetical protein